MTQVLKAAVRERILAAGREAFFERGYHRAALADIARRAGVSTANIYRYYPAKSALFEAVLPDELIARHDELLDARIDALVGPVDPAPTAADLLDFWVEHRLAVATLLDHDGHTTPQLLPPGLRATPHRARRADPRRPRCPPAHRRLLVIVFDNTRRAIAAILRSTADPDELRALIAGFWSYQVPGLGRPVDVDAHGSARRPPHGQHGQPPGVDHHLVAQLEPEPPVVADVRRLALQVGADPARVGPAQPGRQQRRAGPAPGQLGVGAQVVEIPVRLGRADRGQCRRDLGQPAEPATDRAEPPRPGLRPAQPAGPRWLGPSQMAAPTIRPSTVATSNEPGPRCR